MSFHHSVDPGPLLTKESFKSGYPDDVQALESNQPASLPGRATASGIKGLVILALSIGLAAMTLLPLAAWLGYMLVYERTSVNWTTHRIISTAPVSRVLILGVVSSKVGGLVIGPVMALHAYIPSTRWLAASSDAQRVDTSESRLTALQLATSMNLYMGANALGLWTGVKYVLGLGRSVRKHKKGVSAPGFLTRAVWVLAWLLLVEGLIAGSDFWLHLDARSETGVKVRKQWRVDNEAEYREVGFSRVVNQTECAIRNRNGGGTSGWAGRTCGLTDGSATASFYNGVKLTQTLTNTSSQNALAWLEDGTAILVPPTSPRIAYRAESLGVRSDCRSITKECVNCNSTLDGQVLVCQGALAGPNINCTGETLYDTTQDKAGAYPKGAIFRNNGSLAYFGATENPFAFGDVVQSSAYYNQSIGGSGSNFISGTGFLVSGRGAWNVIYCDISVLDVIYDFSPPSQYQTVRSVLSNATTADFVASQAEPVTSIYDAIDGAGQGSGPPYTTLYARELNKVAVAGISQIVIAAAPLDVGTGLTNGSSVSVYGMGALILTIAILSATVVGIGISSARVVGWSRGTEIEMTRQYFLSVIPVFAQGLGRAVYQRDDQTSPSNNYALLEPENQSDRLMLNLASDGARLYVHRT